MKQPNYIKGPAAELKSLVTISRLRVVLGHTIRFFRGFIRFLLVIPIAE